MKVKIFSEDLKDDLERKINSFLKKESTIEIKSLQYSHCVDDVGEWHNALMLYE